MPIFKTADEFIRSVKKGDLVCFGYSLQLEKVESADLENCWLYTEQIRATHSGLKYHYARPFSEIGTLVAWGVPFAIIADEDDFRDYVKTIYNLQKALYFEKEGGKADHEKA